MGIGTRWYNPGPGAAAVLGVIARQRIERLRVLDEGLTASPNCPTRTLHRGYCVPPLGREATDGVAVRKHPLCSARGPLPGDGECDDGHHPECEQVAGDRLSEIPQGAAPIEGTPR